MDSTSTTAPEARSAILQEPWGRISLPSLISSAAAARPAAVFIRDCPDRAAWNDEPPRQLTFSEFQKAARFFAAQLHALGIAPGERVLLLLPNIAEFAIAFVGTTMLGAIPAIGAIDRPIDTLRIAAERCGAVAIITTGRVGAIKLAEKARHVAAKVITIRALAAFGPDLPDGAVPLDGWSNEEVADGFPAIADDQTRPALITFAPETGALAAFTRTQSQLMADVLALTHRLKFDGNATLLQVMQPGAAASVAAGLVLPLMAGARIQLLGPFARETFTALLAAHAGAFVYGPLHLLEETEKAAKAGQLPGLAGFLALVRMDEARQSLPPISALNAFPLYDFQEGALLAQGSWPVDGALPGPGEVPHPLSALLPAGLVYLDILRNEAGGWLASGFAAASVTRRADAAKGKAA